MFFYLEVGKIGRALGACSSAKLGQRTDELMAIIERLKVIVSECQLPDEVPHKYCAFSDASSCGECESTGDCEYENDGATG